MRIGIISDVHSNNYALQKLFEKEKDIACWLCAGDIVGLFPNVNETIELMQQYEVVAVAGDHEYYLMNAEVMQHSFSGNDSIQKQRAAVTQANLQFIEQLRHKETVVKDGKKIHLTHALLYAKPDFSDAEKYRYDWSVIEKKYTDFDIVISGHNHLPSIYYGKQVIFINPGSLGFPIGKWARPSYCILNTDDNICEFKYLSFGHQQMIADIGKADYNKGYIDYLNNNFIW
jgi:putative phosphoesterase